MSGRDERKMQFIKIVAVLPALLLAGMVIVSWASAAATADTGIPETVIISLSLQNDSRENIDLNDTNSRAIKPLSTVPVSGLKNIAVPEQKPTEQQTEIFSDRDWGLIRKSMTDLTEDEQDRLIVEWKKIQNTTSTLSPGAQANVSLRMGYYIINATEGGKPADPSGLPLLPPDKPEQKAAALPFVAPLIAVGGCAAVWILVLRGK
jgi:hypothetical protein